MKILVISDVHGNLAALEAVCKQEKSDVVFCLGDLVNYGPFPRECIAKVKTLTDKVVRGNHDNAVGRDVDCGCSIKYKEHSDAGKEFTKTVIQKDEKDFLGKLPITLNVEMDGKRFLLSHGSPRGDMHKYLRPDTTDQAFEEEIRDIQSDVVFIGHTHFPLIRKVKGTTIINPGSVGQPRDGVPTASYAVWENGEIGLRRVHYDIEATVKGLHTTGMPPRHVAALIQILRNGGM